ncbi:MBL fold metallo-hydrolase [Corticibacterium sp. UT-5YL-CI-8]|nr:MBL fold metallo-hydrolase [Tianweitania sp. UT-5YL-CI-8]
MTKTTVSPGNRYYGGPNSDHFDGKLFLNPGGVLPLGFRDVLRWQFNGLRSPWPKAWPSPFPQAKPLWRVTGEQLSVTMVGHSTLLLQVDSLNILTDPVWSERVSPVRFAGPRRVNAPGIAFDDLPKIDVVLLSHNHYDHMDIATLRRLQQIHDPLVITPLGNDAIVKPAIPMLRVSVHDWGDTVEAGEGIRIHVEPAHHWSARGARDRRMALWGSFVIETPVGHVYFAGDTGFHEGRNYRLMAEKYGGFRLAILPIGAYEPRWFMKSQHQNPDEAVEAMRLLKASHVAGCHWGTFQLTDEPIEEPRQRLHAALDREGVSRDLFRALQPGEVWQVPVV